MGKIRAFSKRTKWNESEAEWLMENYCTSTRNELRDRFPNRTIRSVETKANLLGLRKPAIVPRTQDAIRESKKLHMQRKRHEDPSAVREYQRRLRQQNPERSRERNRRYLKKRFFWSRATKLKGSSKATHIDLARIWRSQKGLCALTGRKLDRSAQVDHIIPKAKGGDDRKENLRWVCKQANLARRELSDAEFLRLCSDVVSWIGERIELSEKGTL